jgi:hypothetical protein
MALSINIAPLSIILLLLSALSCRPEETPITPNSSIEGIYQATVYRTFPNTFSENEIKAPFEILTGLQTYPINGHKLTMEITSVAKDSVQVRITPTAGMTLPKGLFSPTTTLAFSKAYVKEKQISANEKQFFINLNSTKVPSELNEGIEVYGNNQIADYLFDVSSKPYVRIIIKFEKLY